MYSAEVRRYDRRKTRAVVVPIAIAGGIVVAIAIITPIVLFSLSGGGL